MGDKFFGGEGGPPGMTPKIRKQMADGKYRRRSEPSKEFYKMYGCGGGVGGRSAQQKSGGTTTSAGRGQGGSSSAHQRTVGAVVENPNSALVVPYEHDDEQGDAVRHDGVVRIGDCCEVTLTNNTTRRAVPEKPLDPAKARWQVRFSDGEDKFEKAEVPTTRIKIVEPHPIRVRPVVLEKAKADEGSTATWDRLGLPPSSNQQRVMAVEIDAKNDINRQPRPHGRMRIERPSLTKPDGRLDDVGAPRGGKASLQGEVEELPYLYPVAPDWSADEG